MGEDAISIEDVERARRAIDRLVTQTPALRVPEIDARCGCTVALKAESLQQSGSFKLRGASKPGGIVSVAPGSVATSASMRA